MAEIDTYVLQEKSFWRALFVEFFGTTLFLFLVTAVLIHSTVVLTNGFCIGLAIAVLAHILGPLSGGHFNPAITMGTIVTGDSGFIKACFYIGAQLVGGIAGSAITYAVNPADKRGPLGNVALAPGYSVAQGFFTEMLLTGILVFAFLASSSSDNNRKDFGFSNALAVGLSITLAHLVGIPYTGSSINPARAFGPAVIGSVWHPYHWMYWVAPFCGGIAAAFVYRFIIKPDMDE